jgi:hypothetical protein
MGLAQDRSAMRRNGAKDEGAAAPSPPSSLAPASGAPRRRVLIIVGSYAPTMIADMHRARHLAWELPKLGWDVEILSPDQGYQPASCIDVDSAAFFAPHTPVHAVPQRLAPVLRAAGIGSIGMRAILPALRAGRALLARRRYDLLYISTAQSVLFLLGPIWRRAFGIPFVLDLHDPVLADGGSARADLKHRLSRALSRHVEARAVTAASGLVSVSPQYLDDLRRRYRENDPAWLAPARHAVIPFAVLPGDLAEAARTAAPRIPGSIVRIVYVGTGGPVMARSFSLLCRALSHLRARRAERLASVRIELHGTASAVGQRAEANLAAIACGQGLAGIVTESPARVSYRRSLELLTNADGALILGVDDPGYMPSKLFTYGYSGKPILASLHRGSPGFRAFQELHGLGHALWFDEREEIPLPDASQTVAAFLQQVIGRQHIDRRASLEPYSGAAMARRHAALFAACVP